MKTDKNIFRLKHILESIGKIKIVTEEVSQEIFDEDWKIQDIVIRNLEIIGEASNHIDDNLKIRFSEIMWDEIRGLRNIIAHVYFEINTSQIWETIQNDIPQLENQIQQILKELNYI